MRCEFGGGGGGTYIWRGLFLEFYGILIPVLFKKGPFTYVTVLIIKKRPFINLIAVKKNSELQGYSKIVNY